VLTILVALVVVLWPAFAGFYTTWLWFKEVGYQTVFATTLKAKLMLGVVVGLISFIVIWINLKLALRNSPDSAPSGGFINVEGQNVPVPDLSSMVGRLALPASLVIGAFAGASGWGAWDLFLRFRHQSSFGQTDPIFGRDISFYFFTLPALEAVAGLVFTLLLVSLIGSAVIYLARGLDMTNERGFRVDLRRGARGHLLALGAGLFLALAWQASLGVPNLLFSTRGPVSGTSYTDLAATLPMLRFEMVAAVIAAVLAIASIFRSGNGLLFAGVGIYLLSLLGGWLYPAAVHRFSVAPNELAYETPYIIHNIAATRKAFGLEAIEERELGGEAVLTAKDIQDNQRTINNIRLWDQQPLLDTFAQIQEIRTYYEFQSVDNDRYKIGGESQQVMLSARELASESLPNRNWINEHFTFTHGFGITLGPVNQGTPEGLPVLYVKDLPPNSTVPSLKIGRPEIYFGELSNDRVYVKTKAKEFSYPSGEENVFANYEGDGGVSVGSFWRQLIIATRFRDLKLLLSNDLTPESRVLFNREIRGRLAQVAPFLTFDKDPYLVIAEEKLFWIADAYTASNRYPYSQPIGNVNYIRNSVKAVIDAYHGSVNLYIADPTDPIIQTYSKIFPGILRPLADMPDSLRSHLRYPEDIFRLQTSVYATYHMDNPQVFYNKEDQWTVASMAETQGDGQTQSMEPYYTIMKLPGEQTEEFILMLPFTPKRKDNLASWMVARADGENYGRLRVYRFPKQKLIFGPKQIVARINQDAEISRQLSLWNQRGSQVILGTLLVIPIKESLIYVQPLYLRAESGKIPELKRVIVAAESRIAMEPTLEASLSRIFGSAPSAAPAPEQPTLASASPGAPAQPSQPSSEAQNLLMQARQHYDRAMQAQRDGDWARYGEEIKRLGQILESMSRP
jgi:uncharacterized membrane protein (UPF0182 family)